MNSPARNGKTAIGANKIHLDGRKDIRESPEIPNFPSYPPRFAACRALGSRLSSPNMAVVGRSPHGRRECGNTVGPALTATSRHTHGTFVNHSLISCYRLVIPLTHEPGSNCGNSDTCGQILAKRASLALTADGFEATKAPCSIDSCIAFQHRLQGMGGLLKLRRLGRTK